MNEDSAASLNNWIPFRLAEENGQAVCRWLYTADIAFTDPFFNDTIVRCKSHAYNSRHFRSSSSPDILSEWAEQANSIAPTAMIFHISRCGSTLISQLLGLQPANIVLSEVPFIDELLRKGFSENKMNETLPLVKAAMALYGTRRTDAQQQLFIKTDSWHIHFYKQLRELYPQVPFILLYRRPDEVIRSQQKIRGMQAVQGVLDPAIFGFDKNEIMPLGLDEYMAKVIESYLSAFIEILKKDKLALPVNYKEGAVTIINKIAAATGLSIHENEKIAMRERLTFHAKYPEERFEEAQLEEKIPAYLNRSFSLYEELEKIRKPLH